MELLDDLETKLNAAAVRREKTPDQLKELLFGEVLEAARDEFGHDANFRAFLEEGRLRVVQIMRVQDVPTAAGDLATSRLRARDLDVQDGDELEFDVPFTDPRVAAAHDREWGWLTGIVTAESGLAGRVAKAVRTALGIEVPVDATREGTKLALLLAVLPEGANAERERLVEAQHGSLQLRRSYRVGLHASREELAVLLDRQDLPDGSSFELFEDMVTTERLLVGLVDPIRRAIARAAEALGVAELDVISELKRRGLDLAQRTLDGKPWRQLVHPTRTWVELKVVDHVRAPSGEISLVDAKLLDPSLALGAELKLPGVVDREHCARLTELFANDGSVRFVDSRSVTEFERLRPIARVLPTPPTLRDFELGPLRALFPEGFGVLYADVPGLAALDLWRRLSAAAGSTGFQPVILSGNARDLRAAFGAWTQESREGLQAGTHPSDSPQSVLDAVDRVDVGALLAPGGNPSYRGLLPDRGEWPAEPSSDRVSALLDLSTGQLHSQVRLALVEVDAAWKTIAYLPMLLQAGEATPSLAQACAVSRTWERQFGARVLSVGPATIEWWLDAPPSREVALQLAPAHFTFTPEGGSNVLEVRANELASPVWMAWWD